MESIITDFSTYQKIYQESVADPESFWEKQAQQFIWKKKWTKVLSGDFSKANSQWFVGGQLNITENTLDRHLLLHPNKTAIIWEPNNPDEKTVLLTYRQLHEKVCQVANALRQYGIQKGDRVCLYMPMVPELTIALLACARIGAIHLVVFAGFSAQALADRIADANPKIVITADGFCRGNKTIHLKNIVDEALQETTAVQRVIVFQRIFCPVDWDLNRDVWWQAAVDNQPTEFEAVAMDSEDVLFILYTSGSTGKPKGIVHTVGGYMVYVHYSFKQIFRVGPDDVYWCTADIGWITGHSYLVYAPLLAGVTTLMFEGIPTFPDAGRYWQIIAKHKVNQFYTAPTVIRTLMAFDISFVESHNLNSLKLIGSVGEPINEEAWHWFNNFIGQQKCPIVDTWWQTETGGILISPLPNVTPLKPSFATLPLPGIQLCLLDLQGNEIHENNREGLLCVKFPWPSMLRTVYKDHQRCQSTYFDTYPNYYFTGDGARRDEDGYYRIIGRVDDVINVSGHRLGTAEIENAINKHAAVVESAVVAFPHSIKGQGIYAYVVCNSNDVENSVLKQEVLAEVVLQIGSIAKPDIVHWVDDLPKTRSGKIMRRILRKIAEKDFDNLGDISTLSDPSVVEKIKNTAVYLD